MVGIIYLFIYLLCGILMIRSLLLRLTRAQLLWLGSVWGLVLLMWLPALCSMVLGFTFLSHVIALVLCLGGAAFAYFRMPKQELLHDDHKTITALIACAIPFVLLTVYLQLTHTLRPENGTLHVGQSTWGDLSMHLGFITSIARQGMFPPEYSILPGTLLSYPFLADSLSSSLLLLGLSLRMSVVIPGVLMMILVYMGFFLLAQKVVGDARAAVLACILFFLNGGLGFIYFLDGMGDGPNLLASVLDGFYKTPANLPDLNLRWSNVIADILIPQRTQMAGWMVVLPCIFILWRAMENYSKREFIFLGLLAGSLPMIHTHSFLALFLIALAWMLRSLWIAENKSTIFTCYVLFGIITAALALPQLLFWTLKQSQGENFIRLSPNWVNFQNGKFLDSYLWFWLKNVGVVFPMLICAFIDENKTVRKFLLGGVFIFIIAEVILFQPNPYDNNKLFYIWYMISCIGVSGWLIRLWDGAKKRRSRVLIAAALLFCATCSGLMSLGREIVSDFELYSAGDVEVANYVTEHTGAQDVILTGLRHNNPIPSLTGRNIVCGASTFLYFHGLDYFQQEQDVITMYTDSTRREELLTAYNVRYIFISGWEQSDYPQGVEEMLELYPTVFTSKGVTLLQVPD